MKKYYLPNFGASLDLTARPQADYLLTLMTQDGHRHTARILKQSEVFGKQK